MIITRKDKTTFTNTTDLQEDFTIQSIDNDIARFESNVVAMQKNIDELKTMKAIAKAIK